jgi:hypothetical protein
VINQLHSIQQTSVYGLKQNKKMCVDKHDNIDKGVKVVHELGHNDVLLGRGAGSINYVGNVLFREVVKERRDEYLATSKRQLKDSIARDIVQAVALRKGRFLRKIVSDDERKYFGVAKNGNAWIVANYERTLEKVKQSLRDREYSPHEEDCVKPDWFTSRQHKVAENNSSTSSRDLKPLSNVNIATNGDYSSRRGQSGPNPLTNNCFAMYQDTGSSVSFLDQSGSGSNNSFCNNIIVMSASLQDRLLNAGVQCNSSDSRQQMSLEGILQHLQSPNMNDIASMLMLDPHLLSLATGRGTTQMLNRQIPSLEVGLEQHLMLQLCNRIQQQYQVPTDFATLLFRQQEEHLQQTMLSDFGSHIGNTINASPLLSYHGMGMSTSSDNDLSPSSHSKRKKRNESTTTSKEHKKQKIGN